MGNGQATIVKPEQGIAVKREDLLLLIREDTAALSQRNTKLDDATAKKLADFEKRYGLVLGFSGPLEKRSFLNGERSSIHLVFQTTIPDKRKEEFLRDAEKLAELGIVVSLQIDGSLMLTNSKFLPELPEQVRKTATGLLEKAGKLAEKGEIERALSMHLAFVSLVDCFRNKGDAEKSAELAEGYEQIGGRDIEKMSIFKGPDKRFSKEKFEELMGISYDDYLANGLGYIAVLRFKEATMKYEMAATYYLDTMMAIADGKQKDEYERTYLFAKEVEMQGTRIGAAGAIVLSSCRMIREGPRAELTNISELLVGTGLSHQPEFSYISAEKKTEKKIKSGELKLGDRKVKELGELLLTTEWGTEMARPAVRELVKTLQELESYQKLVIIYTLAGESEKVEGAIRTIQQIQKTYERKFSAAVTAYSDAMIAERSVVALGIQTDKLMQSIRRDIESAIEKGEISKNAGDLILKRLKELEQTGASIGLAESLLEAEAKYDALIADAKELTKALLASIGFEKWVVQVRRRLDEASSGRSHEFVKREWIPPKTIRDRRYGEMRDIPGHYAETRTSALSEEEKQLYDSIREVADRVCGNNVYAALETLRTSYDPFTLLRKDVTLEDIVKGKKSPDKLFNTEEHAPPAGLAKIGGIANALYTLTWKARKTPAEGFEAVRILSEVIVPNIANTEKRAELGATAKALQHDYFTHEKYDEFMEELLTVLKEESFHKAMKEKEWYAQIGPYVGFYLDKYDTEITVGMVAAAVVASIATAEPGPVIAVGAGRAVFFQAARRLAGTALTQLLSPKQLAKTIFSKGTLLRTGAYLSYPYLVGGTITGIDSTITYFSTEGVEQKVALDDLRRSAAWLAFGVGGQLLPVGKPLLKNLPRWVGIGKTTLGLTGNALLLSNSSISIFERFQGPEVDWLGVAGDTALLTLGSVSAVRTVNGLRAVGTKRPVLLLSGWGGTAGELSLFVGGTTIMLKDQLSPEQKEAVSILESLHGTPYMKDLETAYTEIKKRASSKAVAEMAKEYAESLLAPTPKMTQQEKEKYELDMSERVVVQTLFPDLFDRYLSDDTTPEKRAAVVNEICKRIGWKRPDAAVFEYLRGQALAFSVHPSVVKESEPKLYAILDGQQEAIKANRRYMIRE